ncbi:DnaJ-domain-containing protein [Fomitiporia mediterranea MF3/22]|uniref:DnaJ-domain-containing protein n=1 Tax=Fomitiporia mediterranea (strain MF3/22) TaxID=694068 RepID=UPI00044074A2|nr:DnaJ-domain-containing protein [Fomitiporia mediterranea MF3/22]EJC98201.1 DnaJ-domain-containing protein [Fomitiporia mediterranea MF3/22]
MVYISQSLHEAIMQDPEKLYRVLEVDNQAADNNIKDKYRELAKLRHPDKNPHDPDATRKFQELQDAYEILADVRDRKWVDDLILSRKRFKEAQGQHKSANPFSTSGTGNETMSSDNLRSMFREQMHRNSPPNPKKNILSLSNIGLIIGNRLGDQLSANIISLANNIKRDPVFLMMTVIQAHPNQKFRIEVI